uniref:AIG1-type G domain-containing protein n=1 Tax=Sphaeramia orbicularis TaxID=375764 RepID=A0A673ACZ4_9TELE
VDNRIYTHVCGKTPPAHLRLVMVGAQWSAKSSAGNIILKKDAFSVYHRRTTEYCEIGHSVVAHRHLTVVDSPGWFYNHTLQDTCEMDKSEIKRSMYLCPPGPHAILLVVGLSSAFNASYQRAVQEHMSMFSEEVWNHTIVLFTRDWLKHRPIEEYIAGEGKALQQLVEKCRNEYHVLNCNFYIHQEVLDLFPKIYRMVAKNKGHYSTMEEEWNRREQELIDHMLRAIALENEPVPPHVKMAASLDGVFVPSSKFDFILRNTDKISGH